MAQWHLQSRCPLSPFLLPECLNESEEVGTFCSSHIKALLSGGRRQQRSGTLPALCHAMVTDFMFAV